MSRRKRPAQRTLVVDWDPELASWFALIPASWTPPARIRVTHRGSRSIVRARFTTAEGRGVEAFVRYHREGDDFILTEEGHTHHFRTYGAAG